MPMVSAAMPMVPAHVMRVVLLCCGVLDAGVAPLVFTTADESHRRPRAKGAHRGI